MAIESKCECGKRYRVDEKLVGKRVRCKACQKAMLVEELVELDDSDDLLAGLDGDPDFEGQRQVESHRVSARSSHVGPLPLPAGKRRSHDPRMPPPPPLDVVPEVPFATPGTWQTMASNPALLRLRPFLYLRNYPASLIVLAGWIVISIPFLFGRYPWIAAIPMLLGIANFALEMYRMKRKVGHGCVNPATVVGISPGRVAIFADLTMGEFDRPSIKIISAPVERINNGELNVGDRLAVVALYSPGKDVDAWDDIVESMIQLVSPEPNQISRIMHSIPADEWRTLDHYLATVDATKIGIYKLWKSGAERFKPHNPATVWVVFSIFCLIVFVLGLATYDSRPRNRTQPLVNESTPVTPPVRSTTPTPQMPRSPVVPPAITKPAMPRPVPSIPPPTPSTPTPPQAEPAPATKLPKSNPFEPKTDSPDQSPDAQPQPRGERPPPLSGLDLQRLARAPRDPTLEKVEMLEEGQWKQGRVIKRVPERQMVFVYYEGSAGRGRWFMDSEVRPR